MAPPLATSHFPPIQALLVSRAFLATSGTPLPRKSRAGRAIVYLIIAITTGDTPTFLNGAPAKSVDMDVENLCAGFSEEEEEEEDLSLLADLLTEEKDQDRKPSGVEQQAESWEDDYSEVTESSQRREEKQDDSTDTMKGTD